MGKKIPDVSSGGGNFLATAYMKEEGKKIVGVLKSKQMVKTQYGEKPVYTLTVEDATCDFSKDKAPYEPKAGEDISLFATTRLERQLVQVEFGARVTIIHAGKKKVGRGQAAHTYSVEVG